MVRDRLPPLRPPLTLPEARVSARTRPVIVHRDVKSPNIVTSN